MGPNSKKRTLEAFFTPVPAVKKARTHDAPQVNSENRTEDAQKFSTDRNYPFRIPELPFEISSTFSSLPSTIGKVINDQEDLDLLYFQPYIPKYMENELFKFLRGELPFYRVEYKIKRGGFETDIRTPRWTTVFGLDDTSRFDENGRVVDPETRTQIQKNAHYAKYPPRPLPKCLDDLRITTEAATGCVFNFCLVNYYASGADSISYHSDDERFLGALPAIASFSLGATRDFLMKHKPIVSEAFKSQPSETKPIKLPLASGDMILMRGRTQANWLHSIPKRSGRNLEDGGRINLTFRRAMVPAGTENYYNYNVGNGPVYKWDNKAREMKPWTAGTK